MFDELRNLNVLKDEHFLNPADYGFSERRIVDPVNNTQLISNYDSGFFLENFIQTQSMSPIVTYSYKFTKSKDTRDFSLTIYDVPVSEMARPGVENISGFFELPTNSGDVVRFGVTLMSFMELSFQEGLIDLLPYPVTAKYELERHEHKAIVLAQWISDYCVKGVSDSSKFTQMLEQVAEIENCNSIVWYKYQETIYDLVGNRMEALGKQRIYLKHLYYETEAIFDGLQEGLCLIKQVMNPVIKPATKERAIADGFDQIILGLTPGGEYQDVI